jgi:hypothetical protein
LPRKINKLERKKRIGWEAIAWTVILSFVYFVFLFCCLKESQHVSPTNKKTKLQTFVKEIVKKYQHTQQLVFAYDDPDREGRG